MSRRQPVILITNANNDFGEAIAIRFAQEKPILILGYANNLDKVQALGKRCEQTGSRVMYTKIQDISEAAFSNTFQDATHKFGYINSVINTMSISRSSYSMTMKSSTWENVLKINLFGAVNCINGILPTFIKQQYGNVILLLSLDATSGVSGHVHQSAAESAALKFMQFIAREVGPNNVRINAVIYGFIMTKLASRASENIKTLHLKDIPLGYYGTPMDVAETVAYLASDHASYITGQAITVDGGLDGASYLCWQMMSSESELE